MSLPHFFLDNQVLAAEGDATFTLRLAADDAKHARVMRLAPGEHVAVVDAAHDYFECEIVSFDAALPQVRIAQRLDAEKARPSVMVVQGLAKGDKMETVVRHATELGVAKFVPLVCERSIVRLDAKKAAAKTQRWRAIAKSAAMQSGQHAVPEVSEPVDFNQASELLARCTAVLVCWEEAPQTARIDEALAHALANSDTPLENVQVAVVVGPEGGFAQHEVDTLLAGSSPGYLVSLGPSILRTETAGIVAPALALHELDRLARAGGRS